MDPVSAAVLGGANVLGGAMQGAVNEKTAKAGLNVEQLLGQRGLDVQSAAVGDQIRRQMESMPLRDRLLAQLQARMGQAPAAFNPAGMWGNANHPASTGGVDQGALQQSAANYQPGTGGTRPDIAAQMMNRLGYTPMGGSAFSQGGNEWQKTLGQKFGSAPQSWANTLVGTESGNLNTDPLRWASANVGHAGNQMTGLASSPGGGGQPEVFGPGGHSLKDFPLFTSDIAPQPPTNSLKDIPATPSGGTPSGMFPSLPNPGGNSLKDIAATLGGTPSPPTPQPPVASSQPPIPGTPSGMFPSLPMKPPPPSSSMQPPSNPGTQPPTNPAVPMPPQPPMPGMPPTPAIPSWQKAVAGKLMPRTPF